MNYIENKRLDDNIFSLTFDSLTKNNFMEITQTPENALSHSTVKAIINAPIEKVNIADWLFNLPDAEYQKCSTAHIAAGFTRTPEGEPMSINVETIGNALIVQHYVATEYRADYCRMLSVSDSITANGRSKVQVLWELKVTRLDDNTCQYTNEIHATATPEFFEFMKLHNITIAQAAHDRQVASDAHNHEETPLFAKSIEKKALTGEYGI
ncbi:hypothetical protein PBAL39_24148 [Pedobacter sp. BAL39]|uniref:hypothetical protein n=1 Tax=Pedobacter sp. BAL39 TaxID=391596 RepID=UPI000155B24A|nr:hypothetical protein [Pedobacter sp. BAL39]EDM34629.1 hypothetical protein PBAL39_24148 [Pedobacter sp. BAL39]